MKKILSILLTLTVIVMSAPVAVHAATDTEIIDKHGAKTYRGNASDWSAKWNEDNFTEVTDKDVTVSGNLTIKAGDIKDVTVNGSSNKLTITNGNMDDVVCDGTVDVSDGTIGSIESNGDMTLKGGTIKRNAQSYQKVTINGNVTVKGSVIGQDVISSGSTGGTISGSIQAGNSIELTGNSLKVKTLDGGDLAELSLKNYDGKLPEIKNMVSVSVDASSSVTANGNMKAGTLTIAQKGEFVTTSLLELNTLTGPGTLSFNAGKLMIHNGITGKPLLNFNNIVRDGVTAFKADRGMVNEEDALLYDFELKKETSSSDNDIDEFVLTRTLKEGITLNQTTLAVNGKTSGTVKASVKPSFSEFAEGTKVVWELHGETKGFSISSNGLTCTVSANSSATGSYKATLLAYLVDGKGDRLTDYRSDSCVLTYGAPSEQTGSGITLDTYTVTIGAGSTYWVLAVTDAKTAPVAISYNSSVATVGAGVAYNKDGKTGWLYPVTGVAKGGVTIDIGGQKMAASIAAGSIVVDTASYTMNPGGKYYIGVKISGIDRKNVDVHSQTASTTVQYAGKNKSGLDLYVVTAGQTGAGAVVFEIIGGQSVQTKISVENGVTPHGVSGRLIAAA